MGYDEGIIDFISPALSTTKGSLHNKMIIDQKLHSFIATYAV